MFKDATNMVRDFIAAYSDEWDNSIHNPEFEKYFTVKGAALKNVPNGYDKEHVFQPYFSYIAKCNQVMYNDSIKGQEVSYGKIQKCDANPRSCRKLCAGDWAVHG